MGMPRAIRIIRLAILALALTLAGFSTTATRAPCPHAAVHAMAPGDHRPPCPHAPAIGLDRGACCLGLYGPLALMTPMPPAARDGVRLRWGRPVAQISAGGPNFELLRPPRLS